VETAKEQPLFSRRVDDAPEPVLPARRLERVFGRPASEWTVDDLVGLVKAQAIRIVSLMHVGSDGWLKTLDFVPRSESHLRDVIEGGERADGSSIFAGTGIRAGASDILLRPRLSSAFLDPFSRVPAVVLRCSHAGRDGAPLPESPDTIVRAAFAWWNQQGHTERHNGTALRAGSRECLLYLVDPYHCLAKGVYEFSRLPHP